MEKSIQKQKKKIFFNSIQNEIFLFFFPKGILTCLHNKKKQYKKIVILQSRNTLPTLHTIDYAMLRKWMMIQFDSLGQRRR